MRTISALGLLALVISSASAQLIFDSGGFESPAYSLGALSGQNGWGVDTAPGDAMVIDVAGNQVVQIPGGGDAGNWYFPSLNHTPAPDTLVVVEADIARTLGTTSSSFCFALDLYDENVNRIGRAGLVDNGGIIQAFVTTRVGAGLPDAGGTAGSLAFGGSINADQFAHFKIVLDFATQTFRVEVDSSDLGYAFPFISESSTLLADADLHVALPSGADDYGRFDNYVVSSVPSPEPSSVAALAGLAVFGLAALRRRR